MEDQTAKNWIYIFSIDGTETQLASILREFTTDTSEIQGLYLYKNRLIVLLTNSVQNTTELQVYDLANQPTRSSPAHLCKAAAM